MRSALLRILVLLTTDGPGAAAVVTSIAGANREVQLALKYHF